MKKLTVFFIFLLFLAFIPPISAQTQELKWEKVTPSLGEVAEIVISPTNPNIMYAGFEVNAHSLYKSEDGGSSWKRISGPGDHTKDIAVSPKDPNIAYVAMSESVHTTDLSIKPTRKSMFDGGFQPTDRKTQTVLSSGISPGPDAHSFSSFEIFDGDDKIMYATLRGGDHGIGGPVSPKLFKTKDRGVTWQDITIDLPSINVITIHPENSNTIYLGSRDGVFVSFDSGTNIKKISNEPGIISLEVAKTNPKLLVAARGEKVIRSLDGGESWQDATGKLFDIHRVRVAPSSANIWYAATFNGVFRSDDQGKNWQDVSSHLKAKNIQIVSVHPQNPNIAFIGHSSLWSSVRAADRYKGGLLAHQGIYKTEDAGKTWNLSTNGISEYNFEEVATNPAKEYEAWFAGVASVGGFKTEDGGQNWRRSQLSALHYPMRIKYSLQDPNKVFATSWHTGGSFAKSLDGGVNWEQIDQTVFGSSLASGKKFLPGGGGERYQIHLHGLAVDPRDDNIIYVGSVEDAQNPGGAFLKGAHILKSKDGGKSWIESDEGFPHDKATAIHDLVIDPKNTQVIYAATTRDEAKVGVGIYKSEDGGKTWKAANNGLDDLSVLTIIVHPKKEILLAAGDGGLYRLENRGQSWKKTSSVPSFDVEYVIDEPDTVYASTNNGVLKSRDFGKTWVEENLGLPQGEGQGIGVDKTGKVIFAAVNMQGLFVARTEDIPRKDLPSEFGKGYGPFDFAQGKFNFGQGGPGMMLGGVSFLTILFVVIGAFTIITLLIFSVIYWKNRRVVKQNG